MHGGNSGNYLAVNILKQKMLELPSARWTLTLDMCRNPNNEMRSLKKPEEYIIS